MLALYEILGTRGHVVTQVVEAKFVVGPESNVCIVGRTSLRGVGLMLVNAVHTETMEHIERSHPLGVTLCEIIVHRYDVYAIPC